jgi:FixJ family two-component response regulator
VRNVPVISIVDDDPSVRRALRRLLQAAGYSVEAYASAVDFLASPPIDRTACLVLDIRLDGMTGFDLQARLAADQMAIPIIFITAHDDVATRDRVQEVGAAAYLPKPFDPAALLAAVRSAAGPA